MARGNAARGRRPMKLAGLKAVGAAVAAASAPGGASVGARMGALPRLVKAVASGEYTGVSAAQLALLTAAGAYVVSPVDLLPEAVLGVVGMADDAVVLTWFATHLVQATDDFLQWELRTGTTLAGERVR